jgi:hypothetical protein
MNARWMTWLLGLLLACGGSAGASQAKAPEASEAQGGEHTCTDSCPMEIQGTKVSYAETPDGAALVFVTEQGDVAELQRRVANKAVHQSQGGIRLKAPAPGEVPHATRSDTVDHGARLIMTPNDASQLEALRKHVKDHADTMSKKGCSGEGCSCDCEG